MTQLSDTKAAVSKALKACLSELNLPGETSKKVSVKMRLEAKLHSGCTAVLACAEVTAGRPTGHFGLYWLVSLQGGPVYRVMSETGLASSKSFFGDGVLSMTSHNLDKPSHVEVGADADFDAVARTICDSMRRNAFPLISAFEVDLAVGADLLLSGKPLRVRNPFTTCVILLHLARRADRIEEALASAPGVATFYDFVASPDPRREIVEPIARWFEKAGASGA